MGSPSRSRVPRNAESGVVRGRLRQATVMSPAAPRSVTARNAERRTTDGSEPPRSYRPGMTRQPPHIVIAGGGVAAVEAVAALRALAGPMYRITLLAPEAGLTSRPASVATPFGFGSPAPLPFDTIRRHANFELHRGTLARIEADAHIAVDDAGEALRYDKLLVAVGAESRPALPGAICFAGPADAPAVSEALDATSRLAFVLPTASGWALPVYELAIMAATELRSRGVEPQITVVTPEPA